MSLGNKEDLINMVKEINERGVQLLFKYGIATKKTEEKLQFNPQFLDLWHSYLKQYNSPAVSLAFAVQAFTENKCSLTEISTMCAAVTRIMRYAQPGNPLDLELGPKVIMNEATAAPEDVERFTKEIKNDLDAAEMS